MANKDNKNKQDFGGFGKGVNKAGKTYFYESNKSGGFGIKIIKESEFKKLLKKKESEVAKELKKKMQNDIAAKKKADAQIDKDREQRIKDTAKAVEEAKRLSELALEKFESAGIKKRQSISDKEQNKQRVQQFVIELSKHISHVSEQYYELIDKHSQLSSDNMYKVISGRVLKLSLEYNKLFVNMESVYETVRTKSSLDAKYTEQLLKFLSNIESLDLKLGSLLIDVDRTEARVEAEKQQKQKKIDEKNAKISAKDNARKSKVRKRRVEAVAEGRARQRAERRQSRIERVRQGRELQEQQKQQKIDALYRRHYAVDDFFDLNQSSTLHIGKKIGKKIGGILGATEGILGLDFNGGEGRLLSGLFSPVKALSKLGYNGIKSLTQNALGVSSEQVHEKETDIENRKAKSVRPNNVTNNSSSSSTNNSSNRSSSIIKNISKSMMGGAKSIFNNSKNLFGGKSSQNTSNNQSSSQNTSNNSSSTGNSFANTDFNRSDDKKELVETEPITDLLEKILKEIQKQNGTSKSGGGMFGGVGGKAALIGAASAGVIMLGTHIKEKWDEMFSDRESEYDEKATFESTREHILNKLKDKNASEKDIERVKKLMGVEQYTRNNMDEDGAKERLEKFEKERKAIYGKYYNTNNNINNTDSTSIGGQDSSSTFRKDSVKSTISAEVSRIEKIKDIKDNPDERMEKLFKFLGDIFIPKLSDSIANSLTNKKGAGKSIMPSVDPF